MKKLFTLIAAALMAVGVNAQTEQNLFFGGAGTNATIFLVVRVQMQLSKLMMVLVSLNFSHVPKSMVPLICSAEKNLFLGMNTRD